MAIVTFIKDKLGVKHEIGAKWDNVSGKPSTFAPSDHNHNASDINAGTLPIARGGTGATTWQNANEAILGGTAEEASDFGDDSQILCKYVNATANKQRTYYRKVSRIWTYIKSKLGISSAVGSTTNPVYVDSNGQLKAVGGTMLKQGSLIDTHSEGNATNWLDGTNELFAFYDRGGTCTAYEYDLEWDPANPPAGDLFTEWDLSSHKTTTAISNISANVFNSLTGYNQSGVYSGTKFVIYDLKLPAPLSETTKFFWSFGISAWKPKFLQILNYSTNWGERKAVSRYRSTDSNAFGIISFSSRGKDANGEITYFTTHIRIVMSKYSRISGFGMTYYESTGLATNYLSRTVDRSLFRSISVGKDNTYNLGSSSAKWANVFATKFSGTATNSNYSKMQEAELLDNTKDIVTEIKKINTQCVKWYRWNETSRPTNAPTNSARCLMQAIVQYENGTRITLVAYPQDTSEYYYIAHYAGIAATTITWRTVYTVPTSTYSATGTRAVNGTAVASAISAKADAASVTGATKCKVTYNSQGVITAGADLAAGDIPNLAASKITSGTFADERIASASKWNAKQDDISNLIPTAASASNPLCDKAYADAIGERLEARYLGCNANGDPFATHAALTSASKFYYQGAETTPDTNDITTVVADEDHKNTSNVAGTTRYRYGGVDASGKPVWAFEYVINNTGLSQAQLLAVNSGITATKVGNYDSHLSDTTKHITAAERTAWNGKQNALTQGTNITISGNTISATDTTYSEASKTDVEKIVTDLI